MFIKSLIKRLSKLNPYNRIKELEAVVKDQSESHKRALKSMEEQHKLDYKEIDAVVQKLVNIEISREVCLPHTWRLVTEIDAMMIMTALERGNDNTFLHYIASNIAHRIFHELKSINIQRPETFGLTERKRSRTPFVDIYPSKETGSL